MYSFGERENYPISAGFKPTMLELNFMMLLDFKFQNRLWDECQVVTFVRGYITLITSGNQWLRKCCRTSLLLCLWLLGNFCCFCSLYWAHGTFWSCWFVTVFGYYGTSCNSKLFTLNLHAHSQETTSLNCIRFHEQHIVQSVETFCGMFCIRLSLFGCY